MARKDTGFMRRRIAKERGVDACIICEYPGPYLEMHHAVPVERGGADDIHNVIPLCELCHCKVHGKKKKKFIDKKREAWRS